MADSIMQDRRRCYITHRVDHLERHHVMNGPSRKKAEEDGLWIWLCHDVHMYVHAHAGIRLKLKAKAQEVYENRLMSAGMSPDGARMAWMARYHKNYEAYR